MCELICTTNRIQVLKMICDEFGIHYLTYEHFISLSNGYRVCFSIAKTGIVVYSLNYNPPTYSIKFNDPNFKNKLFMIFKSIGILQ